MFFSFVLDRSLAAGLPFLAASILVANLRRSTRETLPERLHRRLVLALVLYVLSVGGYLLIHWLSDDSYPRVLAGAGFAVMAFPLAFSVSLRTNGWRRVVSALLATGGVALMFERLPGIFPATFFVVLLTAPALSRRAALVLRGSRVGD